MIAKNSAMKLALLPALAKHHGLITGATGTGKTVTLQKLAERFSAIGVPVFMAGIKGDLSGTGRTKNRQGDAAKTLGAGGSQADGAATTAPTNDRGVLASILGGRRR